MSEKKTLAELMRERKSAVGSKTVKRARQNKKPVIEQPVRQSDGMTAVLQNQLVEASGLLQGYSVVVGKLVSAVDALSDKNDFLNWVKSIDAKNYPAQAAMIRRIQKWKRESFLVDSFELMQLFLKQKSL